MVATPPRNSRLEIMGPVYGAARPRHNRGENGRDLPGSGTGRITRYPPRMTFKKLPIGFIQEP
jgi:hypothetical protein